MSITHWARCALAVAALCGALPASAAVYPDKPVSIILSFPPGNAADIAGRAIARKLGASFGQAFVVDNVGGAGGIIGVGRVANAKPDGYTLSITSLSPITILPLVKKLSYDPLKQLQPISLVLQGPMVLVVPKDSPFKTMQDLIDYARAHPGKLNYGSLGPGTISQLTMEMFKAAAHIDMTEVPYKGSNQALTDLIGGQLQVMFDGTTSAISQIKGGAVRGLAVSLPKRSPLIPDIPSVAETGIPGLQDFEAQGWVGVFAPPGTPREIIEKLNKAIYKATQSQDIIDAFASTGQAAIGSATPEDFAKFVERDANKWQAVGKMLGLKPE